MAAPPQQHFIVKSLHNGADLKRFRVTSAQLTAAKLLEEICEQHEGLERGRFTAKLEVKGRPALEPLGTEALRNSLAAAGGKAASSVVLRLFSYDVRAATPARARLCIPCEPPPHSRSEPGPRGVFVCRIGQPTRPRSPAPTGTRWSGRAAARQTAGGRRRAQREVQSAHTARPTGSTTASTTERRLGRTCATSSALGTRWPSSRRPAGRGQPRCSRWEDPREAAAIEGQPVACNEWIGKLIGTPPWCLQCAYIHGRAGSHEATSAVIFACAAFRDGMSSAHRVQ